MGAAAAPIRSSAGGASEKVKLSEMFRASDGTSYAFVFALVSSLFALWGFCNGLLDILNQHFKDALKLSNFQSQFVQSAAYMGYFCMALPAGGLARRFGYKGAILIGLGLIAAGAFWFIPATGIGTYWAFLMGLFILASGLTCLETVANPYTTVLGPARGAAARINLAQSCNGIGAMLGPIIGGSIVFGGAEGSGGGGGHNRLYIPYLGIGIVVTLLVLLFARSRLPDIEGESSGPAAEGSLWSRPHFSFAVVAQFLYVGAQTCIFANSLQYFVKEMPGIGAGLADVLRTSWVERAGDAIRISKAGGSVLLSFGLGMFLLGRVSGAFALRVFKPHMTLGLYCLINTALMALVILPLGWLSTAALFLSFFFMSIMFPTIFSLGIEGLGPLTKRGSAFIVMAIVGGALIPLSMGRIADAASIRVSFVVPLVCFVGIVLYAVSFEKLRSRSRAA